MKSILFVCTGNICRSPSAHAVFAHYAAQQGKTGLFQVESAGTHGYHVGERPDERAVRAAQARGISMDGITAQKLRADDFDYYDYIVAMDQGHLQTLSGLKPADAKAQLSLFGDYCTQYRGQDVPDPYYGDLDGFEHVLDMLEDGMSGLLQRIQSVE